MHMNLPNRGKESQMIPSQEITNGGPMKIVDRLNNNMSFPYETSA